MNPSDNNPMRFERPPIEGLCVYHPKVVSDERGAFVKTYHRPSFANEGFEFDAQEEFYSTSARGVIRGMHFQIPDRAHAKTVTCLHGSILDVVLDLRRDAPTYGKHWSIVLSASKPVVLHIPVGFAHGFLSLEDESLVYYRCTTPHSPEHDRGIRWDSFGFEWPVADPILSERDHAFPSFTDYDSPFRIA